MYDRMTYRSMRDNRRRLFFSGEHSSTSAIIVGEGTLQDYDFAWKAAPWPSSPTPPWYRSDVVVLFATGFRLRCCFCFALPSSNRRGRLIELRVATLLTGQGLLNGVDLPLCATTVPLFHFLWKLVLI